MNQTVNKNSVLITGYVNPDLDAYACAAGYAELWQQLDRPAQGACYGSPLEEVNFALSLAKVPLLSQPDPTNFDHIIVVDTSDTYHLDPGINPALVEEVVDHHLYNDPALFPNAYLDIQPVGAAATLVVERFAAKGVTPSQATAILLYGAIISNTLNFKAKVTTGRDLLAAAWIKPIANLPQDFVSQLFQVKSDVSGTKLIDLLKLDMSGSHAGGKIFSIGQLEMVGVPQLLDERLHELQSFMVDIHTTQGADVTFLSLSDVDLDKTYFVSPHAPTQRHLEQVLPINFANGIAEHNGLILRKEYVGPVKEYVLAAEPAIA